MITDEADEPLEFQKELLEEFEAVGRQDKSGFVSHATLMKEINDILSETRTALRASKGVPPPSVK
ncbi:hypothetical protein D3C75_1378390 [compost metagenome]